MAGRKKEKIEDKPIVEEKADVKEVKEVINASVKPVKKVRVKVMDAPIRNRLIENDINQVLEKFEADGVRVINIFPLVYVGRAPKLVFVYEE